MNIPVIENRKYICVKIDEICGEGADGYCVKKEDQGLTDPFLIEIKTSSSKIGKAENQIKKSFKKFKEGKPETVYVVYEEAAPKSQQLNSYIVSLRRELGVNVEVVMIEDEKLKEMRDIIDRLK